jgi:hypothetical protein
VGDSGTIVRYNGSRWTNYSNSGSRLLAVGGTTSSNVFFVGETGTIRRWNGSTIAAQTSNTTAAIQGVWGAPTLYVWAVTYSGQILRYYNGAWSVRNTLANTRLYAVWGTAYDNFYVGGEDYSTGSYVIYQCTSTPTCTLRYSAAGTGARILAIWGNATGTRIWASGTNGKLVYFNGTSWAAQTSPAPTSQHYALWGAAENRIFLAANGVIYRWNGRVWKATTSNNTNRVNGIWGAGAGRVFAVGDDGTILVWKGNDTAYTGYSFGAGPRAVWSFSDTSALAVGPSVWWYNGNTWEWMDSAPTTLRSVWASSEINAWAVGGGGTLVWYNYGNVDSVNSTVTTDLNDIWSYDGGNLYAVGAGGTILRFNSGTYVATIMSSSGADLQAVWGFSGSDVFAVGSGGTIRHYDGTSWSTMSSGVTDDLTGVWGSSGSNVYAVGRQRILKYNGTSWSVLNTGINGVQFYRVWGVGADDFFVTTDDYGAVHWDGVRFSPVLLPTGGYAGWRVHGTAGQSFFFTNTMSTRIVELLYYGSLSTP